MLLCLRPASTMDKEWTKETLEPLSFFGASTPRACPLNRKAVFSG